MLYCKHIGEIDMKYSEEIKTIEKDADVSFKEYCENVRTKLVQELQAYNPTEEDILRVMRENLDIIEGNYIHTYNYYRKQNMNWRKIFDESGVIDGTVLCLSWLYE